MLLTAIFQKRPAVLLLVIFIIQCNNLWAGAFTPGNIVVVRVGIGNTTPSNASTPVFLDEYTPTGTLVQSIPLPKAASGSNHALTLSGTAITEGALSVSTDGRYLVMVGFDTTTGYANVSTGVTNRTIALIDSNGNVNTTTGYYSGSAYVDDNFRSGFTTDGTGFWTSGDGNGTSGGTWFAPFGAFTANANQVDATIPDTRVVRVFDGQLYFTANGASGNVPGLYSVGTGTPTTGPQTVNLLPGFETVDSLPSPFAFYFFDENPNVPGVDVVYICDDDVTAPVGGLYKYSLVNGTWIYNGNITNANGLRGLTGYKACSAVNLFLTADNAIYSFTDTGGYNEPLSGSLTQIGNNGANTFIRGISLTPGTSTSSSLQASITSTTNVTCYGDSNGIILSTGVAGHAPYAYNWGNGITTQDRNELSVGNYTVTVTDALGCSASVSASVSQPAAVRATALSTSVSCYGSTNGSIQLLASGGTPPYKFNGGDPVISNLSAGTYAVTVTDSNNCSTTVSAIVNQPRQLAITDSITNLPCSGGGDSGAIRLYISGGTPAYSYLWSNDSTYADAVNLAAGNYQVTVTDSAGCSATFSAAVSQSGNLAINPSITSVKCYGQSNGAIQLAPTGGSGPYNFSWNNTDTSQGISQLSAGNYTVTVTDQANCTLINTINVPQPDSLSYSQQITNVRCNGDTDGIISLNVTGGTPPYSYLWTNSNTTASLLNVIAGVYTVSIKDSNGCQLSIVDTLTQPLKISAQFNVTNDSVFGGDNGYIETTLNGGTSPYTYSWSNGVATQNDSNLIAGSYCLTITDFKGCTAEQCTSVSQPSGILNASLIERFYSYMNGDDLFIHIDLKSRNTCTLDVFDLTGRTIFHRSLVCGQSLNYEIPGASLASGCYLVRIGNEQFSETRKIMVTK